VPEERTNRPRPQGRPQARPRPEARWDRYLAEYHDAHPGITADVMVGARDADGRSPYDWLVEAVPPGASVVIDLACGSGPVTRLLGARGVANRVVCIDQSAGELVRARSDAPGGLLVRARATALPVATASADAVVASMALMVLAPLEAALAEARRLLRPGGTFVATVPSRSSAIAGPPAGPSPDGDAGPAAFAEILATLGQAAIDYPEPLDAASLTGRFTAAGLTLRDDDTGVFLRTVGDPDDADLVVRSFYAPMAETARVATAVAVFQRRVRSAPVRVGYRIRRLVAVR
jgi:SAM-dependent methyltransferase